MKKFTTLSLLVAAFAFSVMPASALDAEENHVSDRHVAKVGKKAAKGEEYRRSSLCMIMIEDPSMPMVDVIRDAFFAAETPSKYNDHNVGKRVFSIADVNVDNDDLMKLAEAEVAGRLAEKMASDLAKGGTLMSSTTQTAAAPASTENVDKVAAQALKFMGDQHMAYELARKWFYDEVKGENSMGLVQIRGMVDASAAAVADTATAQDPSAMLMDAGIDLVNNTFVVASRFRYMSKDELFEEISTITLAVAKIIDEQTGSGIATMAANAALIATKAAMGDGYFVRSNSYLFQLHWSDELKGTFIDNDEMWNNPEAWEANKDKFTLKYIGMEKGWANTKAGIFSNLPEEQLVRAAAINSMDNVLAKLEKRYEIFKTKVPLMVYNPPVPVADEGDGKKKKKEPKVEQQLYMKIGVREGLGGGEKFEVLEPTLDKKTGVVTYLKKGTLKVDKERVWDNTYNPESGYDQGFEELAEGQVPTKATFFDGEKAKFVEGYVLRQIK